MNSKITKNLNRKAAEPNAGNSAVVVIIIAGLLVFYLLMVSPAERTRLLDGDSLSPGSPGNEGTLDVQKTLLQENIGSLTKMPFSEKSHEMSAVSVTTNTDAQVVSHKEGLYIRNSVFTKKFPEINFELDKNLANNMRLGFNVEKASGILMIYLNGNEVFAGEIKHTTPPAIELQKEYLKDDNKLTFYLYRPTWAFWRIDEYQLNNVNVFGDIKDVSNSKSDTEFPISSIEYENIDEATLFFLPDCDISKVGTLSIYLNERKIYSAIPDCGVQNYIILNKQDLYSGKNSLSFRTSKGYYLLDQLKVKTKLKDQIYPVYYFDLDNKYFYNEDNNNNNDNEDTYKYFCAEDGQSIYLQFKGETEDTGWNCTGNKDCMGNFKIYNNEKSKSTVRSKLCENLNDDEFKYSCAEDGKSILLKKLVQSSDEELVPEVEDTGWNCPSGKSCKNQKKVYNIERLAEIVKDDICNYDDDNVEDYFGNAEIKEKYDVTVSLRFPDLEYKEMTVWINGYRKLIATRDHDYDFNIDTYVSPGSNAIELVPGTQNIRLTELKVDIDANND